MKDDLQDLDKLIEFIADNFKFNEQKYPQLKGVSKEEVLTFAIKHSALHFAKTAGKIAAVSENVDHGGELDIKELKENVSKSLINTLRLADLAGISDTELLKTIKEMIK